MTVVSFFDEYTTCIYTTRGITHVVLDSLFPRDIHIQLSTRIEFIAEKRSSLAILSPRVIPLHNLLHSQGFASLNEQDHVLLSSDKILLLLSETIFSLFKRGFNVIYKFFIKLVA